MPKVSFFIVPALFLLASCTAPQTANLTTSQRLDSLIEQAHAQEIFSGTVTIGNKEGVFYRKAIGIANRVWQVPMQQNTRFDIASVSKSFVAAMILKAEQEGRLSLNDPLCKFFPKAAKPFSPEITLHQMLCHLSGLPDYNQIPDSLNANKRLKFRRMSLTSEEYANFISQIPPYGRPMGQFHYSSLAYHLLSIILEQVYAKPFPDILQEKICRPLRMNDTFSELSNQVVHERVAEPYDKVKGKWERNTFIDLTLGRRIFSTTDDLYLWGKALADSAFLGERAYKLLTANHVGSIDTTASYGYGIGVFEGVRHARGDLYLDRRYLIHGGFTDGYKAMFVVMQGNEGYIFTMLANTGTQIDEYEFARKVMKVLVDK